jgi:hypothetical protein
MQRGFEQSILTATAPGSSCRRLHHLSRALAPPTAAGIVAAAATAMNQPSFPVGWEAVACSDLARGLHQGTVDPRTLPPAFVREFMRPSPDSPTETERIMAGLTPDVGLGVPPRPLIAATTGEVSNLPWLESLRDAALQCGDLHRAAYIEDVLGVLRPRPPLTLQEAAPASVAAKAKFFLENGFVCVENVLSGPVLERCQAAWEAVEAPSKAAWLDSRAHNTGMARHSFLRSEDEERFPVVARKWFGIDSHSYGHRVRRTRVNPMQRPFLQLDPAFIDLIHNEQCPGRCEK